MIWLTLACLAVILMALVTNLIVWMAFQRQLLENQRKDHLEQRTTWNLERERLMNRVMTKDWESYAQLSQSLVVSSSSDLPPQGLSDETEAARWAEANGILPGTGEVFVDLETAQDLGFVSG